MKFTEIYEIAADLQRRRVDTDFYRMCLCYALQDLFEGEDHEPFTHEQFLALDRIMYNYCEDNYRISPWEVADAIMTCCEENGVAELIADYDSGEGTMLEDKICEICQ